MKGTNIYAKSYGVPAAFNKHLIIQLCRYRCISLPRLDFRISLITKHVNEDGRNLANELKLKCVRKAKRLVVLFVSSLLYLTLRFHV